MTNEPTEEDSESPENLKAEIQRLEGQLTQRKRELKQDEIKQRNLRTKIRDLENSIGLFENSLQGIATQNTIIRKAYKNYATFALLSISLFTILGILIIASPELLSLWAQNTPSTRGNSPSLKYYDPIRITLFKAPMLAIIWFTIYGMYKLFRGFMSLLVETDNKSAQLAHISYLLKEYKNPNVTYIEDPDERQRFEEEQLDKQHGLISKYIENTLIRNSNLFSQVSNVQHPIEQTKDLLEKILINLSKITGSIRSSGAK